MKCPGHLTKLVHLEMMGNKFKGSIPQQVFSLEYLQYLDRSSNLLSGNLSHEVGSLRNMRILRLDQNLPKGSILGENGNLEKLEELSNRSNSFEGGIPFSIFYLELNVLDLRDNLRMAIFHAGTLPKRGGDGG